MFVCLQSGIALLGISHSIKLHSLLCLSVFLSVSVCLCLPLYVSVCLSACAVCAVCLCLSPVCVCLSACLPACCLPACLSVCLKPPYENLDWVRTVPQAPNRMRRVVVAPRRLDRGSSRWRGVLNKRLISSGCQLNPTKLETTCQRQFFSVHYMFRARSNKRCIWRITP